MINAVTACKILRFEIPNIAPPWPIPFAGARSAQVAHRNSKQILRKLVLSKPPYNLRFFCLIEPGFGLHGCKITRNTSLERAAGRASRVASLPAHGHSWTFQGSPYGVPTTAPTRKARNLGNLSLPGSA